MAKARKKPKTPSEIAAERRRRRIGDFEALDLQPEAALLPLNESVEIRRESRANIAGARRLDAFDVLKAGMIDGGYDATRRLEADILLSRGEADTGRSLDRVDNNSAGDMTDAMISAGERVKTALGRIGERDAWLLVELIVPSPSVKLKARSWRDIVAHVTGETHTHAQAASVRAACANLALSQRLPVRQGAMQVWEAEGWHGAKQTA